MKIVSLGEICDLQNGYAFKSSDYVSFSNTLNCRMSNVRPNGKFDVEYAPKYLPDEYANTYSNFLLRDGDIVIAMTDMANDPKILGVPTIVDTKGKNMLLNQRVGKLIVLKENQVNISYLQYSLNRTSVKKYYTQFAGGGLQLNVGKKEILSVKIPLPPLETQQKIASILDAADTLRQKDRALLAKYDELTQALFLDMFGDPVSNPKGWDFMELKDCTSKIGSGSTPRGGKEAYQEEGISLIRSMNIYDNQFKYDNLAFISDEQADKLKNVTVELNDVLFNITGASVCRCSIVPADVLPARVNQHVSILRTKKNIVTPIFLSHLMISENVKRHLLKVGSAGGAIMEAITKEQLEKYLIPVPPIALQTQFAERVTIIEQQKAIAQVSFEKSEELFNSLLQKAFKGELV